MNELKEILESLTPQGQEKMINTILSFAQAEDIIDGLYKQAEEEGYKPVIPRAAAFGTAGMFAGSVLEGLAPVLQGVLQKKKVNPAKIVKLVQAYKEMFGPTSLALEFALIPAIKDMRHNAELANQDRAKLDKILNTASSVIDGMYKQAKQADDRPKIDCEECGYEGRTDYKGLCPVCGVIMGHKPTGYKVPYTPIFTGEPMSGISVNEADIRGRMEEIV